MPARRQSARESVATPPDSSLRVGRYRPDRFAFRWHHHPEVELTLIDAGRFDGCPPSWDSLPSQTTQMASTGSDAGSN